MATIESFGQWSAGWVYFITTKQMFSTKAYIQAYYSSVLQPEIDDSIQICRCFSLNHLTIATEAYIFSPGVPSCNQINALAVSVSRSIYLLS